MPHHQLSSLLSGLLLFMSLLCFSLMGMDKRFARQGRRRIPERTLLLSALCFGAPGAALGMFFFHHKTRHWYFRYPLPLLALVQLCLLLRYAWF